MNVFDTDQTVTVDLAGADVRGVATGQVMTGMPEEVNSLEFPHKVVPLGFIVTDASASWSHTFPGNSITVVRFKTK